METNSQNLTAIIGGGPAGASAAIYLTRYNWPILFFDAKDQVRGRTSMATFLENFLGNTEPIKGKDFLAKIDKQLARFRISIINEKVLKVSKMDGGFEIETEIKKYKAKFVIIAVGLSDNMPEIGGLDPYYDTSIFHCMTCDWFQNRNKKIAVISKDDGGITTALAIAARNKPPMLSVVPVKEIEFDKELVEKAVAMGINIHFSPLKALEGENGVLKTLILQNGTKVPAEAMFTRLGYKRFDDFLDRGNLKVDRDQTGFIKVNFRNFETSEKNLFAVGPCNNGPDQAIVSAGEGALAAMEIDDRILTEKGI